MFKVNVIEKVKNVEVSDGILRTAEDFVTKPGMVMQHLMSQSALLKEIVCCLQGQGHNEGSYDQNMTLYYNF